MYDNNFTRANPGLIVFLIDQSKSMNDPWSDGKSLAEHTAMAINRCIHEMVCRFTKGTEIKDSANIIMVGYGGVMNSMEAELLRSGSIASLANDDSIPVQHLKQKISDGAGGILEIDIDLKEFVTPKGVYGTPMASAFQLASSLITEWVTRQKETMDDEGNLIVRDDSLDPVPLIINISDGEPTDSEDDVRKYAKEIMDINCPDGNPLIFNIHLSANGGQEVRMPMTDASLPVNDKMSKLLFDISSKLPEKMVQAAQTSGFPNAEAGVKTFLSNVSKVEDFVQFLNFGTKGTGGANIR